MFIAGSTSTFADNLAFLKNQGIDFSRLANTREFLFTGRKFLPLTSRVLISGVVVGIVVSVAAVVLHQVALIAVGVVISSATGLCVYEIRKLNVVEKLDHNNQIYKELIIKVADLIFKLDGNFKAQIPIANQALRLAQDVLTLQEKNRSLFEEIATLKLNKKS